MRILSVAFVLIVVSSASAVNYSSPPGTIKAGTNYFSLPAMTSSLDPAVIFAGIPIDGKLSYWCRQTQVWHVYPTDWTGETYMWHMGYRLEADHDHTISFQGGQPPSERSTCLNPIIAGRAFVSQPYAFEAFWGDFKFSSDKVPGVKVSTAQAVANGWVENYLVDTDPNGGTLVTLDGAGGTGRTVKPWHGYWVTSKIPASAGKLTIYWPTQAAPEPATLALLAGGLMVTARRRR